MQSCDDVLLRSERACSCKLSTWSDGRYDYGVHHDFVVNIVFGYAIDFLFPVAVVLSNPYTFFHLCIYEHSGLIDLAG